MLKVIRLSFEKLQLILNSLLSPVVTQRATFIMATNSTTGLPADYIPGFVCRLGTCNIQEWGFVHYQPSMIGNVLFLVIIDLLGLAQLILGAWHETGLFCVAMLLGLASESSGYIARIMLHFDPFYRGMFQLCQSLDLQ